MIIKTIDKDLDIRDRWLGIRQLKQEYQPNPYARRTPGGQFIKQNQRAQQAANYFSKEQWGNKRKEHSEEEDKNPTTEQHNRNIFIIQCKNTINEYNI